MKIVCKIWLDNNGKAFGKGPHDLLKQVEKFNSLHQAANQMNMSYSKAWRLIKMIEKNLGFSLLDRKVGGPSGGGSRITLRGKQFMKQYDRLQKEAEEALEKIYRKHFSNIDKKR